MLVINKNSTSTLVLTLAENTTLTNPYYLFKLTNDLTGEAVRFIAHDESDYTYRYNQFRVTETSGTQVFTSGTITLNPTGFWSYEVYEQSSNSNLHEGASTVRVPVETGKVRVIGTDTTHNKYNSQTTTRKAYGKGDGTR